LSLFPCVLFPSDKIEVKKKRSDSFINNNAREKFASAVVAKETLR